MNFAPEQDLRSRFQDPNWGSERLKDISLFGSFSNAERRRLYACGSLLRLMAQTHVVVEGEPTRGLYILLDGTVSVYKNDPASDQSIRLTMLEEGASFGELSLFDQAPRSATVVCESICHLFHLDAEKFIRFLEEQGGELQVRFYKTCAEHLAERFRTLNHDYLESQKLLWAHALRR